MARLFKTGITSDGDIIAGINLKSNYQSGDEGGEIFLNKPVTNTTLVTGVTIDVNGDRLRFFENGGTNRGYYIDLASGGTSVGTNLVGGGSGTVTSVAMTVPTGLTISGSPITGSGTLALTLTSGYSIPTTSSQTNWDTAYSERLRWDGGSSGINATTGRVSLGATTVGSNIFTLTNPNAITFLKVNSDNTVTARSASDFRTDLGLGTMATQSSTSPSITTSITTASSPFALINTGATTINFGGAATVINMGSTTPSSYVDVGYDLVVSNSLTVTAGATFGGGFGSTGATISTAGNIDTNGTINAEGSLTVGTAAINGAITRAYLAGGGTTGASINNSGQFIRTSSSARYKQDIQDANFVYEDVLALSPKTFRLKDEAEENPNSKVYGGLIAEEVDQIDSLRVFVNYMTQEDGSKIPDGIAYGEMVAALVSALKHQDARIEALEAQVQALSE
jgi:hypothetical protein